MFVVDVEKGEMFNAIVAYGLYWIPVIGGEKGWVSENFLGYSRLIKWYYLSNKRSNKSFGKTTNEREKLVPIYQLTGSLYSMLSLILGRKTNHEHVSLISVSKQRTYTHRSLNT